MIWTSIIGVILLSMSAGYYFGGKLADKKPEYKVLFILLFLASFFVSIIPILEIGVIYNLSKLINSLSIVAILSALLVFAIPSFLLATISPYSLKLKNVKDDEIGRVTGKLSAFSTFGSIIGTFVSGFYLIPTFGIKTILLIITIILFILSILVYRERTKVYIVIITTMLVLIVCATIYGRSLFNNTMTNVIADIDTRV